jgi:hypothetical protein
MGTLKQYGIVIFGLMLGLGFGGSMFAQNYSGSSSAPSGSNQQTTTNYTEPGTNFRVGTFNKSFNEQVVIAARNDKVFVNAYYENAEQKEELKSLKSVTDNWGDTAYVQIVSSNISSEILTRNGIVEFPKVVVVGATATRRGVAPQQQVISNITQENVERGICNVLSNLGGHAARCQALGAL